MFVTFSKKIKVTLFICNSWTSSLVESGIIVRNLKYFLMSLGTKTYRVFQFRMIRPTPAFDVVTESHVSWHGSFNQEMSANRACKFSALFLFPDTFLRVSSFDPLFTALTPDTRGLV